MRLIGISLVVSFLLVGCSQSEPISPPSSFQEIKGRDSEGKRFAVYRALVPDSWIRRDPLTNEDLSDTTKGICEFIIKDEDQLVRIAIHNFPTETIDQRIPPTAQVARWKRQFENLLPTDTSVVPQAFNGYSGLLFKGSGLIKGEDTTVLAWSLQLSPTHYRMLSVPADSSAAPLYHEMRSDVTIKAAGPRLMMETKEEEIVDFARSFELIEEIPTRS